MSRKTLALALGVLVTALVVAAGASAITNGTSDNGRHPYVGLFVAHDADGNPLWRCSGTLLSPTVFLTAGHCTAADEGGNVAGAMVWFDQGPVLNDPNYTSVASGGTGCANRDVHGYPCRGGLSGMPFTNPLYASPDNPFGGGNGLPTGSYRDVGVVVFETPSSLTSFGALPAPGLADTLKNKTKVDFVGYGVQFQAKIPGNELATPPPFNRWAGPRQRMYAPSELVSGKFVNSSEVVKLALNPGGGSGGTCFGDSGGPDLLAGTNIVLGVNSIVTNVNCSGVGYSTRVDNPAVLSWINGYLHP